MVKDIITFLEQKIRRTETNLRMYPTDVKKYEKLKALSEKMSKAKNPKEKVLLILDELLPEFSDVLTEKEIHCMELYRVFLKYDIKDYKLEAEDTKQIEAVFKKIMTKLNSDISTLNKKIEETKKTGEDLKSISDLINKISKQEPLSEEEFKKFKQLLDVENMSIDIKIKLLMHIGLLSIKKYEEKLSTSKPEIKEIYDQNEDAAAEEVLENDIELTDDVLRNLFKKYGYDYDKLDEKNKGDLTLKDYLKKFGNLNNIERILSKFNGIVSHELEDYAIEFVDILVASTPEIVERILENIKTDLENSQDSNKYTYHEIVKEYLSHSSLWIQQNKTFVKKNQYKTGPGGGNGVVVKGANYNYEKNRNLFLSLGADPIELATKHTTALGISHTRVKINIAMLDLYGIPKELYLRTASCLSHTNPLDVIDLFTELEPEGFDYITSNLSRLAIPINSPIFYNIKYAHLAGEDIYYSRPNPKTKQGKYKLKGTITNSKSNIWSAKVSDSTSTITDNGPSIVGQYYYYSNSGFSKTYHDMAETIVSQSLNAGPFKLVKENKHIKMLDQYFMDENNPRIYIIGGVRVSRYKVLRIYETLLQNNIVANLHYESLMFAICRNSIFTKEEIEKIKAALGTTIRANSNLFEPLSRRKIV